jgi:molybdopterin-guanine dinucleotide biosynthesis protein A
MGRPKAWLPFGDELMLPRVVRILSEVVQPIVVVAAPGQELPPLPRDVLVVRDAAEGRGPLQGLAAGLQALQGKAESAYASSCDVPFLRSSFVRRVAELRGDHDICVPMVDDYHHPLAAVYRIDVLTIVQRLLAENRLRPIFLFDAVSTRVLSAEELVDVDPDFQSLRNLNTPADYESALQELSNSRGAVIPSSDFAPLPDIIS